MRIEIISATRRSEHDFRCNSALGISMLRLSHDERLSLRAAFGNSRGLPELYNEHIVSSASDSALVFMHDDVWIDDHFFAQRIIEGLSTHDVIGVAGNRRRIPGQPAWAFVDRKFAWDVRENLSGTIGHGSHPFGELSYFGTSPAPCELLDGVFLAARRSVLMQSRVAFDPRFDFHCYDMDFCRTARRQGLRLGTWPISLTHQSGGAFGTPGWQKGFEAYLDKWGS